MGLLGLFKVEKLTIEAYKSAARSMGDKVGSMEVMFNPSSLQETHTNTYHRSKPINSAGTPAKFSYTPPGDLDLQLLFDGTGVNFIGVEQLARKLSGASVKKDIAKLKALCLEMNGDIHEPNYLKIRWGDYNFSCRLASLDITYKLFEESGEPLRADVTAHFIKDESAKSIGLKVGKNSPDLTHVRTVRSGDTLPLLCKEIYGSSRHYLRVARDNGLDNFRDLAPGTELHFRPLDAPAGERES